MVDNLLEIDIVCLEGYLYLFQKPWMAIFVDSHPRCGKKKEEKARKKGAKEYASE